MKRYYFFIFWLATVFVRYHSILIEEVNWCESPFCKVKIDHTICKWGLMCSADPGCLTNLGFNKEMKDYIMELHNEKRNKIALGKEDNVPEDVRKAADMNVIQWDIHLEFVARCHSRQCDPQNDDCRVVPRFSVVGQNIYTVNVTPKEADEVDVKHIIENAIEEWYNEVMHAPEEIYKEWDKTEHRSDRFSQMIWSTTSHIGCGLSHKKKKNAGLQYFVVCNYGSGGNTPEKPIYKVGKPCSHCPKETECNPKYTGLCGTIEEYPIKCPCEEENPEADTGDD